MTTQLTAEDVTRLTKARKYDEIEQARKDGRLNVLLGREAAHEPGAVLSVTDIKKLFAERRYDEIEAARSEGRITYDTQES